MRRVVTGHDEQGRSVVVADGELDSFPTGEGGNLVWTVWGRDDTAHYPDGGEQPSADAVFPPVGGCRVTMVRLVPGATKEFDAFVASGLPEFADPARPGMHRTASLDFDLVIEGEVGLTLDVGDEVVLGPGDVVVQNGTSHRWRNAGSVDAVFAAIVIGAENDLVT